MPATGRESDGLSIFAMNDDSPQAVGDTPTAASSALFTAAMSTAYESSDVDIADVQAPLGPSVDAADLASDQYGETVMCMDVHTAPLSVDMHIPLLILAKVYMGATMTLEGRDLEIQVGDWEYILGIHEMTFNMVVGSLTRYELSSLANCSQWLQSGVRLWRRRRLRVQSISASEQVVLAPIVGDTVVAKHEPPRSKASPLRPPVDLRAKGRRRR